MIFGEPDAPQAIAAVDAVTGDVASSARLARPHRIGPIDALAAIERAGLGPAEARLVWMPSRASLSPLYPIWEVMRGGERVYVDSHGRRWDRLERSGPG